MSTIAVADIVKRTKVILPAGTGFFMPNDWSWTDTLQSDTIAEARIFGSGHPENHLRMITFKCEALDGRAINLLLGKDVELELAN